MSTERTSSSFPGSTPRRRARGSCARAWRAASKKCAPKRSSTFPNARRSWPKDMRENPDGFPSSAGRFATGLLPFRYTVGTCLSSHSMRCLETRQQSRGRVKPGRQCNAGDDGFLGIVSAVDTARLSPLEPLAKAYERAVAERPADDGLFGPRSIVWRVNRDRCFPLAGMRSLMIQALHPLAMAGVAEHSNWRQDPFGRLAATSSYLLTTTYGDTASALAAAAWVRKIHIRVRGVDPETGLAYSA